jgi:ABC-type taurine transport system ATPase subunit
MAINPNESFASLESVASGWLTVIAGAQEPQCTYKVHEDSEHRRAPSGTRAVAFQRRKKTPPWRGFTFHA